MGGNLRTSQNLDAKIENPLKLSQNIFSKKKKKKVYKSHKVEFLSQIKYKKCIKNLWLDSYYFLKCALKKTLFKKI